MVFFQTSHIAIRIAIAICIAHCYLFTFTFSNIRFCSFTALSDLVNYVGVESVEVLMSS